MVACLFHLRLLVSYTWFSYHSVDSKVVEFLEESSNKEKLCQTKFADEFYLDVLAAAEERHMIKPTSLTGIDSTSSEKETFQQPSHMVSTSIIAFDDEFETEELVYSIQIDSNRKRIMVCFRGSVTKTDWATDFSIYMEEVTNPVKRGERGPKTVKIHNGFHDYLFETNLRGAKGPNGEPLSQYQEILQEHLLPVIKKWPNYKLYVTGHR